MATADAIKPAYLFAGDDGARIDEARRRLRGRAEGEGGAGALEVFEPAGERLGPDAEAFAAALPAMALTTARRYLLADGVERWSAAQAGAVAAGLERLPPETTVVLLARGKAPARLAKAVEAAGGEVKVFKAPAARELPGWVAGEAARRGLRLERDAAGLLVGRMGASKTRLANELDRLALWAAPGGEVSAADLSSMVADTTETMVWSLSDAVVERDAAGALAIAERLIAQRESVTSIVYQVAGRLRQALAALAALEAGRPAKEVEAGLKMHPYAARQLVARVRGRDPEELRSAIAAVADLETWTRGGADYAEEVALTLALRRACGAA